MWCPGNQVKKVYRGGSEPLWQMLLLGQIILGLKTNHWSWHIGGIRDLGKSSFGDGVKAWLEQVQVRIRREESETSVDYYFKKLCRRGEQKNGTVTGKGSGVQFCTFFFLKERNNRMPE